MSTFFFIHVYNYFINVPTIYRYRLGVGARGSKFKAQPHDGVACLNDVLYVLHVIVYALKEQRQHIYTEIFFDNTLL